MVRDHASMGSSARCAAERRRGARPGRRRLHRRQHGDAPPAPRPAHAPARPGAVRRRRRRPRWTSRARDLGLALAPTRGSTCPPDIGGFVGRRPRGDDPRRGPRPGRSRSRSAWTSARTRRSSCGGPAWATSPRPRAPPVPRSRAPTSATGCAPRPAPSRRVRIDDDRAPRSGRSAARPRSGSAARGSSTPSPSCTGPGGSTTVAASSAAAPGVRDGATRPRVHPRAGARRRASAATVAITQGDVNEIQLAKGAIEVGIAILLEATGTSPETVDEVVVAGAFGTYPQPRERARHRAAAAASARTPTSRSATPPGPGAQAALLSLRERPAPAGSRTDGVPRAHHVPRLPAPVCRDRCSSPAAAPRRELTGMFQIIAEKINGTRKTRRRGRRRARRGVHRGPRDRARPRPAPPGSTSTPGPARSASPTDLVWLVETVQGVRRPAALDRHRQPQGPRGGAPGRDARTPLVNSISGEPAPPRGRPPAGRGQPVPRSSRSPWTTSGIPATIEERMAVIRRLVEATRAPASPTTGSTSTRS